MANLLDRIRNVFADEMLTSKEASDLARESVSAARNNKHSLDATEKIATRGEIATVWVTALNQGLDPKLAAFYAQGRVEQYNKTAPYGQKIDFNGVMSSVIVANGHFLAKQIKGESKQVSQSNGMGV